MSGETVITIVGNLTSDPELRFTPSGAAVADFTVASTPRTYDANAQEWRDGNTLFMRCSVWREAAENVAESLRRGMRVIVQGRLTQRSFEGRDGSSRSVVELQVDEVGPSLRRAKAQVMRSQATPQPGAHSAAQGGAPGGYYTALTSGPLPGGAFAGYDGAQPQQPAQEPPVYQPPADVAPPAPPSNWGSYGGEQ